MIPLTQYRNLRELLKEEQEPFQTHNLKRNASFTSSFRRNACFSTTSSPSPDSVRKSPLFLPAANKNPSDPLFLHVPPKIAALLLEAALRVHNSSNSKPRNFYSGFGLLNSVIKRVRIRTRTRTQIRKTGDEVVVRWAKSSGSDSSSSSSSFVDNAIELEEEGKEEQEIRFVKGANNGGGTVYEDFSSPSRMSPAISPLATSPDCPTFQENANYEQKLHKNQAVKSLVEEDEEEKEQKSPVSILDSPFDNDDCHGEEDEEFLREDGRSDLECSFEFIQRSKRRVLLKLQELSDLYPTRLDDIMEDEEEGDEYDLPSRRNEFETKIDDFLVDVDCESGLMDETKRPWMKRLVYDIISEEQRSINSSGDLNYSELIRKRVLKRLECWREVEANTIDMMIGIDFKEEGREWKKQAEDDDISWTVREIESSVFAGLVQEFLREFV